MPFSLPALPSLSDLIAAAFAEPGPLAEAMGARGRIYRKSQDQIAFAQAVGGLFATGNGALGLFESAAGTGKGLGYLVPMTLFCALTGQSGIVGVSSPGAAVQLARSELAMAAEATADLTGKRVSFARRYAPEDFLSSLKLDALMNVVDNGALRDSLGRMRAFCEDSGLIHDWIRDNGPLPEALHPRDIALSSAFDGDSELYAQHLPPGDDADILLVPQALLVRHARGGRALGDRCFGCAVVDEGEALPETLDHLAQWHLSVLDLPSSLAGDALVRLAQRLDREHRGLIRLGDPRHDAVRAEVRALAARIGGLDRFIAACDRPNGPDIPCLSWSPSTSVPAFEILSRDVPGLGVAAGPGDLRAVDSLCIAAADIDDALRRRVEMASGPRPRLEGGSLEAGGRFTPRRFGMLGFNLSPPTAPKPSPMDEAIALNGRNPDWYAWAEAVCLRVAILNQRTLILTVNAADTAELAGRLRARGIGPLIEHRPGERLSENLAAFRARPDAILIAPDLWEGIDLPGLVKHLVITRLPLRGRDGVRLRLQAERLAALGLSPADVETAVFERLAAQARRRVACGIGRAVRSSRDEAQIWIADPRFPLPDNLMNDARLGLPANAGYFRDFTRCIPERFRAGLFATWPAANLIDIPSEAMAPAPVARKGPSRRA